VDNLLPADEVAHGAPLIQAAELKR
jgi:hypothetical protein